MSVEIKILSWFSSIVFISLIDSVLNFRGCYFHNFTILVTISIFSFEYPVVLSNSTLFLRFDASKRQNSPSLWVKSLPWIDVNCGRQLDSMSEVITIQMMRKTPERHKRKQKFDGKYWKKGFKFKFWTCNFHDFQLNIESKSNKNSSKQPRNQPSNRVSYEQLNQVFLRLSRKI